MPLKLQILSTDAAKWLSWSKKRLEELAISRNGRAIIAQKTYSPDKGIFAQVRSSGVNGICDLIRIWGGGITGFIFHPRNSLFPGGFTPAGDSIINVYDYPLMDDDHGSRLLVGDTGSWVYEINPPENYGNIDWIDNDGSIISWRGPASRSFAMDPLNNYPGFTIVDYISESDGTVHYTVYENLVYQKGAILFEFPVTSKVLGATGTYVILGVDYAGMKNPDGGVNGFYVEVWNGIKTRIGFSVGSRPSVPWFFNPSANEAVSNGR